MGAAAGIPILFFLTYIAVIIYVIVLFHRLVESVQGLREDVHRMADQRQPPAV